MSDQNSLAVVQSAYAAFQRGDIAAVLNSLAEDVEWENPSIVGVPFGGVVRGKAGVAEFFQKLSAAEDVQLFEPREFTTEGERVVAVVGYRARVRATGRVAEVPLVHMFTVRGGKITRFLEFFDTAVVERAYSQAATA
jgi:ketosteroid isomerase-like protein